MRTKTLLSVATIALALILGGGCPQNTDQNSAAFSLWPSPGSLAGPETTADQGTTNPAPIGDQSAGSVIPAGVYSGEVDYQYRVYTPGDPDYEYSSTVPSTIVFNDAGQMVGPDGTAVVTGTTTIARLGAITVTKLVESAISVSGSIVIRGTARSDYPDLPGDPAIGPFTITLKFTPPDSVEYDEFMACAFASTGVSNESEWSGTLTK